jgi:hypothetical protein
MRAETFLGQLHTYYGHVDRERDSEGQVIQAIRGGGANGRFGEFFFNHFLSIKAQGMARCFLSFA